MFLFRLAENQHKTVAELLTGKAQPLSGWELELWKQYRGRYGLASDRLEWGIALAGCYAARAQGSKVQLKHLLPDFGGKTRDMTSEEFNAVVSSMPGVRSKTLPVPTKAG